MDCAALAALFPGRVVFQNTEAYANITTSYWSAFENELKPACVVTPTTAKELGKIIKHIGDFPGKVEVAVKGGGHTAWAGSANTDGGVLINLEDFKELHINREAGTITIGVGHNWGDVYGVLQPLALAVAGGRVSNVGVSGLILGGGVSYFSEQQGFVCDSVIRYEVVLASGEVVEATKEHNSDLFLALKGGNNNFGIVTKFDMKTFHQANMWGGGVFTNTSPWVSLVDDFQKFASNPDPYGTLILARVHSPQLTGAVVNAYSSHASNVSPVLKNMTMVQPQVLNTIREDTLSGFAKEQADFNPAGARQLFFTTSFRLSRDVMVKAAEIYEETLVDLKMIPNFVLSMVFLPVTKRTIESSNSIGANALNLSPADGPLVIVLFSSVHGNKSDDAKVISAIQGLRENFETLAAEQGSASKFRYLNYAFKGTPVFQGYGEGSVAKLKAASEKYDPRGFFQRVVPGGFKISSV